MMFQKTPNPFDHDLETILNRVYRSDEGSRPKIDANAMTMQRLLMNRNQGSIELKQALAELRGTREKSQSRQRMKDEVDYLQEQIRQLRVLEEQIVTLREHLET